MFVLAVFGLPVFLRRRQDPSTHPQSPGIVVDECAAGVGHRGFDDGGGGLDRRGQKKYPFLHCSPGEYWHGRTI